TNMFLFHKKQLISFLMINLLQQIKHRRLALKLKQNDMLMRVGISRQQYQRLEAKGNPRLDTFELIAKGLNSDVMLIPKEKLNTVLAALESDDDNTSLPHKQPDHSDEQKKLSDNPWKGLLENGDEDDNGN
uniref:helix-turn-helix domain-containing protein n=1 Tax=Marinomonas shanghaiensis TaxID=2202418 RepID=UPI003A938D57